MPIKPRNSPANARDPWGFGLPTDRELEPAEWQQLPTSALLSYAFGKGRPDEVRLAREVEDQQAVLEMASTPEVFTAEQLRAMPLSELLQRGFGEGMVDHSPEARQRIDPEADDAGTDGEEDDE